ncbi:ATP-binding protein [Nocardia cyriacigeorgica]|uniref:LuxR family transcriptional regulator n=1 Tax=Nocardia cyriacigeorgica TaxID=135487 RepID=A0A5R8NPW1_9NOCA|nr:LuxR C-terminal-related transcriptional regulator [Nocardia cyriacigeorgica]TLF77678.1 LuxR family transcriptional regulator [Nocardia cyriacigeorgica]
MEVTSFIGRDGDVAAAKRLLGGTRLLTLTGVGGVGKTRLSRRVGAVVQRAFPDGVWLVELAHVSDPDLVAPTVARELGLRDDTSAQPGALIDYLAGRDLLLILDNCEHVIGACAMLAHRITAATTGLRILATSREPLGVPGEQIMPVAPLSVPDPESGDLDGPAARLLVARAQAADPGFRPSAANAVSLAAICRRLDGIPLALELAALRLRMFTPDQVLAHLDDAMALLTTGPRTAPHRQQTLASAIRWSYDLCTSDEQRLWEQLSVFAGGVTLDAVEAVCEVGAPERLLTALTGLVDKSVLIYRLGEEGAGRYTMLEPLRQFGRDGLRERGAEYAVRVRHREYYYRLARRGRTAYWSAADVEWFADVAREHANLRAALHFCLDDPDGARRALEIATELWPFWEHCHLLLEGYRWLSEALAKNTERTVDRARALAASSVIASMLSDTETAADYARASADIAIECGSAQVRAEAEMARAMLAFGTGDLRAALEIAVAVSVSARECAHPRVEMESLAFAGVCALTLDDPLAGAMADRLVALTTEHGSHLLGGLAHWAVGTRCWRDGDQRRAVTELRRSIELFRLVDRCAWIATSVDGLAWAAAAQNDMVRAARLMGAASTIRHGSSQRLGHAITQLTGREVRARVEAALGEREFDACFDAGAALTLDEAVDYAMDAVAPPVTVVETTGLDVLTRRERDVARLIARGYGNRRIAQELVISVRTAESHVDHILVKLGFSSRAQIAVWVSRNT